LTWESGESSTATINVTGGAGADSLTAGTEKSNYSGGGGIDTFIFAEGGLTSADTLAGGDGVDILSIAGASTVSDEDFTNITSVETLTQGTANQAQNITLGSLADAAGLATIEGNGTGVDTITVGAGFDNALTYAVGGAANEVFDASASAAAINVTAAAASITTDDTLKGGTGSSDSITLTANSDTAVFGATITGFETVTVAAATTHDIKITSADGNVTDTTGSLTVNAAALTNTAAALTWESGESSTATINVTGGAGADSLTAGTEKSNYSGGGGTDTFIFTEGYLTSADTLAGGDGTDILSIAGASTVVDADFTNVTSMETLTQATTNQAQNITLGSLADAAGLATITGNGTGVDTITVGAGFDNALTFNVGGAANEVFDASASAAAINVAAAAASITTDDTLKGGTGSSDSITLTANSDTAVFGANVTGFETITVTAATTHDIKITSANAVVAVDGTLTVDASALTNTKADLTFTSNDTGDSVATINVTSGAGADTITAGTEKSNFSAGAGDDTFSFATANLTLTDTIAGGAGTDDIIMSDAATIVDADFTNVTGVETLNATAGANTITLGSLADAAGIVTINAHSGSADTVTVGAGFDNALSIDVNAGDDSIDASASAAAITIVAALTEITTDDTLKGGTGANDVINLTAADSETASFGTNFTGFETITVTAAGASAMSITIGNSLSAGDTITMTAAALTGGTADLSFDGSAVLTTGAFNIIGTAGADTLKGGYGTDTLNGGADGVDLIYSGFGNDVVDLGATAGDADTWYMEGQISTANIDTISNFIAGEDDLDLTGVATAFLNTTTEALDDVTTRNAAGDANQNILQLNFSTYWADAAALLSDMAAGNVTVGSGIKAGDTQVAVLYQSASGSNVRVAVAEVNDAGGFNSVNDIAILDGVTAYTNFAATDFILD